MKTAIIHRSLIILRRLALLIQFGNVTGKAPQVAFEPEEHEKMFGPFGDKKDQFVWNLNNVICSGLYGGAIINRYNKLYLRFVSFPWGKSLHPALSFPYLGNSLPEIEKAIFLVTPEADGNYYHWIVDLLPRLLILYGYKLSDLMERVIIVHHNSKMYENDSLALLGIGNNKIIRLKPFENVKVKNLVVADYYGLNRPFPDWKKQLLDMMSIERNGFPEKMVYLLRGKQTKRSLIGEDRLVSLLEQLGFDIIDPGKLTFENQVNVLKSAKVVVALHGAALTNIIFCEPETLIIELRSTHLPPEHYSAIAETYHLRFETVNLPPKTLVQKKNLANKQDLILTEEGIKELLDKLRPVLNP